ncbi:YfeC-like transcriptional regulator [Superficieibacter sp. 1612_C1]|uniref:YfeC-like transcriptional regulator n=1 Tax=Superficieibacter sp. 1612_C1 TaxID=2780382 RepID=UPI0015A2C7BA|nr:YfeC-like transcriptional regulator [Superficieibacter sp. 1612_C1]
MITLQSKMTTDELAECLGMTKQTINRWVREQKWRTEKIPGVKGGRARLIHINQQVCEYLTNVPALRHHTMPLLANDVGHEYGVVDVNTPLHQIYQILQKLTPTEQQQLNVFLAREGIRVFLNRLGIGDES